MIRSAMFTAWIAITIFSIYGGCAKITPGDNSTRELREVIAPELGLIFEGDLKQGEEKNFFGIRSENLLLSSRKDSRTYFVQDLRWGVTRSGGVFEGPDDELIERCNEVAVQLGINQAEISEARVMQVMSNSASIVKSTGEVKIETPKKGERYGHLSRSVKGIPIFSSRVLMALDRKGDIGFLELHWPEIPDKVITKARMLNERVNSGWEPPQLAYAKFESIMVGIIHSPAVGFVMDIEPVIKVIYRPSNQEIGKKPVLYLDAVGRPVPIPRQFEKLKIPEEKVRERSQRIE